MATRENARRFEGKVALVTGAARGQGRNHAVALAREGADIIAVDVCKQIDSEPFPMATSDDLAETVSQIEALDRRVVASETDVRDLKGLGVASRTALQSWDAWTWSAPTPASSLLARPSI
jgi:NAD(P)-dependent dehydrogenase (short-subunit alcohol dehydrogenase family)